MPTLSIRLVLAVGAFLFFIGTLMHVRRSSLHGQFAAWSRDFLATKCMPRVRNLSTVDALRQFGHDESMLAELAKTKNYEKLTDVLLCHMMENFYDREAEPLYQQSYELEQFLMDFFMYSRKLGHERATIVGYLYARKSRYGGDQAKAIQALIGSLENPNTATDTVNIPPPQKKFDYAGNEMPISKNYDYKNSVQIMKPLPGEAQLYKNLSMDMKGADPKTVHPEIGLTVEEIDRRFQEIVARTGPY